MRNAASAVAAKETLEQKMVYGRQLGVDYSTQASLRRPADPYHYTLTT
jgi:hypothetical protein